MTLIDRSPKMTTMVTTKSSLNIILGSIGETSGHKSDGNCGKSVHNARTCQNDEEEPSESGKSKMSRGSLVGGDENE
ncbi:uncharacterized protein MYCFIDRAFT_173603 [Pseudocercospora fijiensis CIRAD86]|uniref:Uncharacterized protein n=1 Tax=Pseudocercospora fijiensis (strain CIRAD86) TaxID=383855 RepID=M3B5M6_PSEFD|nr:uncharacterized protein MYCFIDRAFT_173603 [Pseudocercospora fijiensis CIRAD86]EME84653.1 hypothetical protein MYCFIDRAFT_173603 [Pseudocercospora fijiensis CIRAD86]